MLTAAICISMNKYIIADIKNLLHRFPDFKNYSIVEVTCLLIRFNRLDSSCETHTCVPIFNIYANTAVLVIQYGTNATTET